ncbi:MAG: YybS family protein [Phascolarctobacterium sp.]|uniref:YybS family protein n=1 Tax=Phascolarctobacterium sp. TaxID=2049039 RepID=UPI0026DD6DCF|nr:YybS family protein [Phascolarctobacterium sp.]MDO4921004.1 YybS family protein [Phascolarctobacterium sp.]
MIRKTSAMVEAGILAAVAIVMALISMYVPVLGAFVNFLWPLPIVICGCRHGFKWSVMTLLVATIIIAMVISPINAFFLAAIFGLLGLILGECMRRHLPPMQMMLYGSIGAVLALIINIVLSFLVLGIDPIEMIFTSFHESLGQLAAYYREHGMGEEEIKKIVDGYAEMLRMMRVIMPGAFLLCAPIMAFVNYIAAKKILTKLGESFTDFPPFVKLQAPGWVLWPYGISLLAVTYFYQTDQSSWLYTLSVNVQTVCSFVLVLQGVVLLYWFVESKGKPRWWANLATALLFVIPLFSQIIVYVGAFDMVFDFRKIRKKY